MNEPLWVKEEQQEGEREREKGKRERENEDVKGTGTMIRTLRENVDKRINICKSILNNFDNQIKMKIIFCFLNF